MHGKRCWTVTVVIPTRDRWARLARAGLASALRQQGVDLDIVLVDDGSRERPIGLPGLDDARVRLVVHEQTRGVAAARNAGIRAARGEWIAFLDDDDLWAPDKVHSQVAAAVAADAGFAYSGAVWVDERLEVIYGHTPPAAESLPSELQRWNVLWGGASNVVVRRELLDRLGGFDETFFQLADWDLWLRLSSAAAAAALSDVHVALTTHPGSMLLTDGADVFREFDHLAEKHAAHGAAPDRARFARWAAAGELRAGRRGSAMRAYVRGTRAPGNVVRAGVAVLGPRAFATASAVRTVVPRALAPGERTLERPTWLDLYR